MAWVRRQTTVVRDGFHNGFTDLLHWQDCYWLGYRKGSAHASIDGEVCLSVSTDRARFREAARLKVPGDNRDPKLIATADGRLALYFPSWIGGSSKKNLQQYVTFSQDGFNWEEPAPILKPHWWLWRVVAHEGRYYGSCYTHQDRRSGEDRGYSLEFLVSDDLLNWEILGRVGGLSEATFHFQPDGEVWMIARCSQPRVSPSYFCTARPPYADWEVTCLDALIHSPVMLEHDGVLYVAGRRHAGLENDHSFPVESQWSLGVWQVERNRVEPVLRLPASGDCAYPGFIEDPEGRICMSYYSQHAYQIGVVDQPAMLAPQLTAGKSKLPQRSDVYFAELELP